LRIHGSSTDFKRLILWEITDFPGNWPFVGKAVRNPKSQLPLIEDGTSDAFGNFTQQVVMASVPREDPVAARLYSASGDQRITDSPSGKYGWRPPRE
jgi:hypothetical protein